MGLGQIGTPKAGETVVVSAASGAVGSVAGQLAKIAGCRAVGIAGGAAKCDYVVKELGFDACVDYKAGGLDAALKAAAPDGVDVYFDNVGGEILDAVLRRVNAGARIPLCGLISGYDGGEIAIRNVYSLLVNRVRLQGFIVTDRMDLWPGRHAGTGRSRRGRPDQYRETVAQGLRGRPARLPRHAAGRELRQAAREGFLTEGVLKMDLTRFAYRVMDPGRSGRGRRRSRGSGRRGRRRCGR